MKLNAIIESFALTPISASDETQLFVGNANDNTGKRVYGGQVMAQALSAAQQSVDAEFRVHSMQCNFFRPGSSETVMEYHVDLLRTGRSFATRLVTAVQYEKPIFTATLSFQIDEQGFEHAVAMPKAPMPDTLIKDEIRITEFFSKRGISDAYGWPIDVRYAEPMDLEAPSVKASKELVWVKANGEMPDEERAHTQMLAYASDNPISSPAFNPHGRNPFLGDVQGVTLSHALWFHRPVRIDDWLLFDLRSDVTYGGRGLCEAKIFSAAGELVASATQEVLMRDVARKAK